MVKPTSLTGRGRTGVRNGWRVLLSWETSVESWCFFKKKLKKIRRVVTIKKRERERERGNWRGWSRERTQIRRLKAWLVWHCWSCQPKEHTWWKGLESRSERLLHRCRLRSYDQEHSSMLERERERRGARTLSRSYSSRKKKRYYYLPRWFHSLIIRESSTLPTSSSTWTTEAFSSPTFLLQLGNGILGRSALMIAIRRK